MPLTLQQIFGTNATIANGELTIKLSDLTSAGLNGTKPSSIFASLLKRNKSTLGGDIINDPTAGVSATSFENSRTFVMRGTETQISVPVTFNIYLAAPSDDFDPDDIVGS
ncbi:hypothetical protein [Gloeothece verrucosa]|uniref:Uncharacterized protein n=1 Tax=Gloeothece verrucosa (strain PCC 7822) TaxID=497965 RepID=E0UD13_GLOV7|nr:hypothetical protein [Gloeothece verrucosa]ADN16478.1 hypothetical protein Cyan7822_4569 [Gloeothece verrucosa PCC 7822]